MRSNASSPRVATAGIGVFAFWVAAQLLTLVICWCDVSLAAKASHGARASAVEVLLCVQITLSACVFPDLLATSGRFLLAIAVSVPLMQFAGRIGESGWRAALAASALLLFWLIGLRIWRRLGAWPAALMSFWVFAIAGMAYLDSEFGVGRNWLASASPLHLATNPLAWNAFAVFLAHVAVAFLVVQAARRIAAMREPEGQ